MKKKTTKPKEKKIIKKVPIVIQDEMQDDIVKDELKDMQKNKIEKPFEDALKRIEYDISYIKKRDWKSELLSQKISDTIYQSKKYIDKVVDEKPSIDEVKKLADERANEYFLCLRHKGEEHGKEIRELKLNSKVEIESLERKIEEVKLDFDMMKHFNQVKSWSEKPTWEDICKVIFCVAITAIMVWLCVKGFRFFLPSALL